MKLDRDLIVQAATVLLVILGGGGNILATKEASNATDQEVRQAISEIHDIHEVLESTVERQKWLQGELVSATERQKRMEVMLQKLQPGQ